MLGQLAVVGLGGAIGAVVRYGLSAWAQSRAGAFPLGTLVVNVLGCLVIGFLMALAEERTVSPETRLFLVVGLLGSLTTFSTFGFETLELLRKGESLLAIGSVASNLLLGVGAVVAGRALVKAIV